jgi:hypothetical protein
MRNDGKCVCCEAMGHCLTDSRGAMCASNTLESLPTDKQQTKGVICPHFAKGMKCLIFNGGLTKYRCSNEACKLTPVC